MGIYMYCSLVYKACTDALYKFMYPYMYTNNTTEPVYSGYICMIVYMTFRVYLT